MTATDLDGADDGTVGESESTVLPRCASSGCGLVVAEGSGLCLVCTVVAELTP